MYLRGIVLALGMLLAGCGENDNPPLAGDIASILVEANATTFYATRQVQMTATASYTHGIEDRNVTENMQWSETNASIATVDAVGLVSGGAFGGDVEISGRYEQFGNGVSLHVIALQSAEIVSDESNLSQEQTLQLRAEGMFEDGATLEVTDSMFWVMDAGESNASIEQNGTLYTGDANGTIEINVTRYDVNATLHLTVSPEG